MMRSATNPKRLLILGGTREARHLADALANDARWSITSSLAGATRQPHNIAGNVRTGGFGGSTGLAKYLHETEIDIVIDATHPFAATISQNARTAASEAGCVYLKLCRPAWQPGPGDNWMAARDVAHAAELVEPNSTVFLTIGRQQLAPFADRRDLTLIARMIEPPAPHFAERMTVILARPPFETTDEVTLMQTHRVGVLVTKNAGGPAVDNKLAAARQLGLPVVMIDRPAGQPPADAATVDEMLELLAGSHHGT